ncbi:MAG: tRNA epoxyqueuosine(34) reductase QueG [candidate division WOR-3 bacterium]
MVCAEEIKSKAEELGIEIGIATAEPFLAERNEIINQLKNGLFLDTEYWREYGIIKFTDPQILLPEAKSILSAALFYLTEEEKDPSEPGNPYGLIARYTQRNYYRELKKRLRMLGDFLKKVYRARIVVHSCGPIAEKPGARRSGIGYYGKHSIIINPRYGSWIVLGEIITDLEIKPDRPLEDNCGECHRCIDACPTKAIVRPYVIDRNRCIQALTNWPKLIPEEIARVWGNRLYGCTTCQDVCPVNKNIKPAPSKTNIGVVGAYLPLIEILRMDEREYRQRYRQNQISARWIHFNAIKRNALLALGNIRDKKTIPWIKKFTADNSGLLKKTARWALSQF